MDLTEAEVKTFVEDWYHLLDVHAPEDEIVACFADEGLSMTFPEGTWTGQDGGRKWYVWAINTFFDEIHILREVNVAVSGERADITLVVDWEARRWEAPAAKSEHEHFDCYQTWVVQRSPRTQKVVILTYVVDKLVPIGAPA